MRRHPEVYAAAFYAAVWLLTGAVFSGCGSRVWFKRDQAPSYEARAGCAVNRDISKLESWGTVRGIAPTGTYKCDWSISSKVGSTGELDAFSKAFERLVINTPLLRGPTQEIDLTIKSLTTQ